MATKIWDGTDSGNEGNWSVADNWSPSGVPVNGDDVYLRDSAQDVTAGFAQSAVTLDSLNIEQSYTGKIGTESTFLEIGATVCEIGAWDGLGTRPAGSGRLNIDLAAAASEVVILDSKTSAEDSNRAPIRLQAGHASVNIEVRAGIVAVQDDPAASSTIGSITATAKNLGGAPTQVYVGPTTTLTTATCSGGSLLIRDGGTTLNCDGGTVTTEGDSSVTWTTVNVQGGLAILNAGGTITTINANGGQTDMSRSADARTVTTVNIDVGAVFIYDKDVVTLTNEIASAYAGPLSIATNAA